MKKIISIFAGSMLFPLLLFVSCSNAPEAATTPPEEDETEQEEDPPIDEPEKNVLSKQNLERAIQMVDAGMSKYFQGEEMLMNEYYNPYTGARTGVGGSDASIWKYTSAMEAVNAVMHGLTELKEAGETELYDKHMSRYAAFFEKLYDNAAYYKGTYTLVSYTQTKQWSVYAVPRASSKGGANVKGTLNVYDDQMWFVRELLVAYDLTGSQKYLTEAEYLTDYILDGWDCTLDSYGNENGGIPWGPGYVTKHSCSNGPMISPLVWLSEMYKGSGEEITHRYIGQDKKRLTTQMDKSEYYLMFAEKIYEWQKSLLLRSDGVYHDMRGGCSNCNVAYETVDGVQYRANTPLTRSEGTAHTYNAGSMLSGAADLYRATDNSAYYTDMRKLVSDSFNYFAVKDLHADGYYSYPLNGYANWFNGVLFRAYVDAYAHYTNTSVCIDTFQQNLDYAYSNFYYEGFLPTNLLAGWDSDNSKNRVNAMFTFAFASEYALLAVYQLER